MSKRLPDARNLDAKTIDALNRAESMPSGPERIEALKKAAGLRHAADTYNYLFSSELRPPE